MELNLGHTRAGKPVIWRNAANPHVSVSGQSGSGKSHFVKGLLAQAAQDGAACIVLDYSADFTSYTPPHGIAFQRLDVSDPEFVLNPLACVVEIGPEMCTQRLLNAIHSAFRLGSKGSLALRKEVLAYLQQGAPPTLPGLAQYIGEQPLTAGLAAALEPLELLASLIRSGTEPICLDLDTPGITVLGFRQIQDVKVRAILVELILATVWDTWVVSPHDHPLILLMDECQNLNWGEGGMATRILREGRKYGIGGWFATQWIDKKAAVPALAQAALQAHFRPDDVNLIQQAKRLSQGSSGMVPAFHRLLRSLSVGEFILSKPNGQALVIKVPTQNFNYSIGDVSE